jgi:hypothetical protein
VGIPLATSTFGEERQAAGRNPGWTLLVVKTGVNHFKSSESKILKIGAVDLGQAYKVS